MNNVSDVLLHFLNQSKMLHWQTKSYAQHMAYGGFYDSFSDSVDEFVEVMMGKYGRVQTKGNIKIQNYKDVSAPEFCNLLDHFLLSMNDTFDPVEDSDLLNIRDEMLGQSNKLKYLLTLE